MWKMFLPRPTHLMVKVTPAPWRQFGKWKQKGAERRGLLTLHRSAKELIRATSVNLGESHLKY